MTDIAPAKIYLEPTTRCNLRCSMCVKQAPGSGIGEGDMPHAVFKRLLPSLGPCPALINDNPYANDCYGSMVPCGHCQWSLDGIRCL